MKATFRSLLVCALLVTPAVAGAGPWKWGVRAGLSLTSIHGEFADAVGPDNQVGFQGGGFVENAPGPIGVALEVSYVQKGFAIKGESTDQAGNVTTYEDHLRLQYLEVPVLVRGSLPLEGQWEPYAVLGPTFGIALSAEFEPGMPGFVNQDLSNDLQSVDMGGTVGLGVRVGRGPYRLTVEARYFTSFDDLWDIAGNLESVNHGFGFTVGVVR